MRILISGLLTVLAASAMALDCPVKLGNENYMEEVGKAIRATETCYEGAEVAKVCAMGSSGDTQIAIAAERKCGLDFWRKLAKKDRAIYNGLQEKCNKKYEKSQGTMYISAAAFCRLSVAELYSTLYTPTD